MYYLGIDVGTTGTKALIISEDGKTLGSGYKGYGLITGENGIVEQRAQDWYDAAAFAVKEAVKGLDISLIKALSISAQGGSNVLTDKNFNPLGNARTWMDTRAAHLIPKVEERFKDDGIYKRTGYKAFGSGDHVKTMMYKSEGLYSKAAFDLTTPDFLAAKLTGNPVIDPSSAGIRQIMDLMTSTWDKDILDFLGITPDKLPKILPAGAFIGTLTKKAADDFGLSEKTKVYNGAHDQYAGLIGSGVVKEGEVMFATGTAWVLNALSKTPAITPTRISTAKHVVKGLYGCMASMTSGGVCFDWFKNNVAFEDYSALEKVLSARLYKSPSLLFFPYFAGSCYPDWVGGALGSFAGLRMDQDKYDMALAVMEGLSMHVRYILDTFKTESIKIDNIKLTGGAAKSPVWLDIISALMPADVYIQENKDSPCLGAAMIAAVSDGAFTSYSEAAAIFCSERRHNSSADKGYYLEKYELFKKSLKILDIYK